MLAGHASSSWLSALFAGVLYNNRERKKVKSSFQPPLPHTYLGEKLSDFVVFDENFINVQDISGAILLRANKSKIRGFGPLADALVESCQDI